jgi:glycosyltransferase involved in cell wall biosynthesis
MNAWNICLTHDPAYGGLYRAVNDFGAALPAATLSFDDGRQDRSGLAIHDGVQRIICPPGVLTRDCVVMPRTVAAEAKRVVKNADLLIVHSMFRGHAPWAAEWARQHGRPFWAVPHGCLDPWGLTRRATVKRVWLAWHGRRFLGRADRILFSTRRELEKALPSLQRLGAVGREAVITWPVALPSLADRDAARAAWRERHAIPAPAILLLFVARLHTMKRPIETITAFCQAAGDHDHIAIIGMDGNLRREQVIQAVPLTFRNRVHVVGPLEDDELEPAWLAGDGFVSLSCRENFGYSAAQAAAHGLPVILSPGHDLAHEMPHGAGGRLSCGWLLPDDSAASATQAIAEFLAAARADPRAPAAMGAAGRSWAADALSPERFADRLRHLAAGQ